MKNLKLILILICCFAQFGFQDAPISETEPKPEQIKQLLAEAEMSIDRMLFDKAHNQLNKSLELAKRINHKRYIALSSSILARMYSVRHEYDKGITQLERAISIQREIEDDAGLNYSYIMYGKILTAKSEKDRALKYLNLAQNYYTEKENSEQLGIIALNKAIIYLFDVKTRGQGNC